MFRFAVRRVLLAVLTLFAISVVTFSLFFLGPADPASTMCGSKLCDPVTHARIEHDLGMDQPAINQYASYMRGVFVGRTIGSGDTAIDCPAPCLGVSFRTREPVTQILARAFPVTLSIVTGAFVVYLIVGIGLGMLSAIRRGTVLDRVSVGFSLSFASMQIYFLGLLLTYFLVWQTGLLPRPQYVSPAESVGRWAMGMLLPWITLGLINSAVYARLARAQMLETLSEDYIRTARAKGLPIRRVYFRHAFRAAVTPLVTIAGLDLGTQLGGVVITESTFTLQGAGRTAVLAIFQQNLPIIMATVLLAAIIIVLMNVVVDMLYAVIDPRVRLS
ncbi:ABC transporter permease subunit [Luedemannella flava]|uniref:ABC transporter permease subunit n=1 Tax=Luedemannella flava TaxID=349316 RepID=A0ABN2MCP6_9ACTN